MKRTIFFIAASVVLATINLAWAADPVCIVGAGPAGLAVASRLEAKGYTTVIFEKNVEVGGRCQDYHDEKYVPRALRNLYKYIDQVDYLAASFILWVHFSS